MDPHNSPSSQDVLRFWEVPDPNFALGTLQGLQEVTTEPISLPPLIPESADEVVGLSDPIDDLIFENITDNVPINGDHNVGPTDFQNGSMDQEEEYNENRNTGYENIMSLTVWPPPPVPFSCSCCQVLRNIVHNNGTHTTKLEIHGRVGLIFHAILEIRFYVDELSSVVHQMIDFCNQSMEDVKQFLMQYCQERTQAGFVMMQDPLSTFYSTICAGISWDDNINTDEFIQPFQTPTGTNQISQPAEENNDTIQPKSSLAAQRERTGRLKLADLIDYFHLPIEVAAKRLAICPTVLKKICRKHGMRRWPHRKLKSVDRQILKLQLSLNEKDGEEAVAARVEIERLKQERDRVCNIMIQ